MMAMATASEKEEERRKKKNLLLKKVSVDVGECGGECVMLLTKLQKENSLDRKEKKLQQEKGEGLLGIKVMPLSPETRVVVGVSGVEGKDGVPGVGEGFCWFVDCK